MWDYYHPDPLQALLLLSLPRRLQGQFAIQLFLYCVQVPMLKWGCEATPFLCGPVLRWVGNRLVRAVLRCCSKHFRDGRGQGGSK
eukprot:306358-Pelagomonas_calceolata.AAC.1